MVWWFSVPKVVFGEDALSELEILAGKRALILTDSVVNGFGFPEKIKNILVNNQWEVDVWDGAVPDPKVSQLCLLNDEIGCHDHGENRCNYQGVHHPR